MMERGSTYGAVTCTDHEGSETFSLESTPGFCKYTQEREKTRFPH